MVSISDKFGRASDGTGYVHITTVKTARVVSSLTLECYDLSKASTTTPVFFMTYKKVVDPVTGDVTISNQTSWKALVNIATNSFTNMEVAPGYTDVGNEVGDFVEFMPTSFWEDSLVDGLLVAHNQDGTLKTNAVTTTTITDSNVTTAKLANGAVTNAKLDSDLAAGWVGITGSISAVTYNGNRSYSLTTSSDNSGAISPGMRLRTTRTVSAPTQVASLNGTNNYFSKTSPAGMAQTDNITVMAWIKLTAYSASVQTIMSRANGTTDGWSFNISTTGQVILGGVRVTDDYIQSYQSVPLNKWVHVAASISSTGATGQVYFDGVAVPTQFANNANTAFASPTADFRIGAGTGGTLLFGGKIAQPAVFSAVIAAATIRGYISQGLSGSETSLISAYSFNNSITDLNTSNANNLTNNNSTSITNADSPFGGQADGTISATKDYAIVQTVSASTLVVQVPEGCTIPTSGGVSACSYSSFKNPYGFPGQKEKWVLEVKYKAQYSQVVTSSSAWLNITGVSLSSIPIGEFDLLSSFEGVVTATGTNYIGMRYTLSTGTTTQSHDYLVGCTPVAQVVTNQINGPIIFSGQILNTTQTTYYLNAQPGVVSGTTTAYLGGTYAATFRFTNSYL